MDEQLPSNPSPTHTLLEDVPPTQLWTLGGYPIVDGKYRDLTTGEIKLHTGLITSGPPTLAIYWHNRFSTSRADLQSYAVSTTTTISMSEYLIRIGDLLRTGVCTVDLLNATKYSLNLIIISNLSREEFHASMREHGLL